MDEFEVKPEDFDAFDAEFDGNSTAADDDDFDLTEDDTADHSDIEDVTENAEETAGEPEPETKEEEPKAEEKPAAEEIKYPAEDYELKHMGEITHVDRAKIIELAQKGLDYDHIRTERDANRGYKDRVEQLESKLNKIRGDLSIDDLLDNAVAQAIADEKGITLDEARKELPKATEKKEDTHDETVDREIKERAEAEKALEQKRNDSISKFIVARPDVSAQDIPQEVWYEFRNSGDLEAAYAKYENKKLRAEKAAAEQNRLNAERSTGSAKSSGKNATHDAFDDGWDEEF